MKKLILFLFCVIQIHLFAQVSWQKMADLPGPGRNHAIGLSHGTKGYVVTGEDASLMKDFYEYNSTTNTWLKLTDYPGPARSYGVGFVVGDKAYIGFGHSSSGVEVDWWEYDFLASKWTQKNDFPGPGRNHPGCAIMNGKIYVGFGDSGGTNYKDWWQYDPSTDKWISKTQYPGLTMHHPVIAQNDKLIYLSEGHIVSGSTNKGSTDFYSYDAVTDKWTKLANMSGPGVVAGATFCLANNKVYSGIGITEPSTSFHKEFYEYDISSGVWTKIANYPGDGVFAPVSFVIGNAGYVVTGQTSTSVSVKDMYKFSTTVPVPEIVLVEGINIYPNPATISFVIEGKTNAENNHYSILNMIGDEVISGHILSCGNILSAQVAVKDLPRGVYFLKIESGEKIITKKIILK
jgi:N-acetylneuraminic acid mutarotase